MKMSDLGLTTVELPARIRAPKNLRRDDPFAIRLKNYLDLGRSDLDALRSLIESEMTVKKRRDLVHDGDEFTKFCFVKEGFAARYKLLRNGKRQIVTFVLPGDIIGLPISFFSNATYSVVALTDMKMDICARDAFLALCYRRPKFGLALSWFAVHEAANHAEHIINIGRRTPVERVAHFLLEIHSRLALVGRATESGFNLPITQEMMADALGLSVPHLNRMISRLRADGMITINDRNVEFVDLKATQQLAQFQHIRPIRIPIPDAGVL